MRLEFKFRDDATNQDRETVIASLERTGADRVEPIFPDTDELELAGLYRAVVEDRKSPSLLRRLKRFNAIEFAEAQPERHLILPMELEGRVNGRPASDSER